MIEPPRSTSCAFTIDVEAFAESHAQSVSVDASFLETGAMDVEIERNLDSCLELLGRFNVEATFFFLGRIAESAPQLVQRAADAGHEIGCHSYWHLRVFGQKREEFNEHLRRAKRALEDASGQPVIGFRAPDFSIDGRNSWAFDELTEAGFLYDSSAVPTNIHDVYGMPDVPELPFRWRNGLVEFPLPVWKAFNRKLPIGGGGYFRLFPVWFTRQYFLRAFTGNQPAVFYIHPYEIGPEAPRLPGLSLSRRLRHYVQLKNGVKRLTPLLSAVPFTSMSRVLTQAGFLAPVTGRS